MPKPGPDDPEWDDNPEWDETNSGPLPPEKARRVEEILRRFRGEQDRPPDPNRKPSR